PALGSPSLHDALPTSTWQRPQMARPPHTESTSTPRLRAACRSGVPSGKWPRLPDGVKTTSAVSRGFSLIWLPRRLLLPVRRIGKGAAGGTRDAGCRVAPPPPAPLAPVASAVLAAARRSRLAEPRHPCPAVGVDAVQDI